MGAWETLESIVPTCSICGIIQGRAKENNQNKNFNDRGRQ